MWRGGVLNKVLYGDIPLRGPKRIKKSIIIHPVTVFRYLILTSIEFHDSISSFVLVSIGKLYWILKTVFDLISKHLKVRPKYSTTRLFFLPSQCLKMRSNTFFHASYITLDVFKLLNLQFDKFPSVTSLCLWWSIVLVLAFCHLKTYSIYKISLHKERKPREANEAYYLSIN